MGNIFNDDFGDFIRLLNDNKVAYLIVGGYAVILHGYRRTTGVIDIWVDTTKENFEKIKHAFIQFGLPTTEFTENNFLKNNSIDVFSYGRPPVSIDIMKAVKGLNFADAWKDSKIFIESGLEIRFIDYQSLIKAKKSSGRHKDMDDIEKLNG